MPKAKKTGPKITTPTPAVKAFCEALARQVEASLNPVIVNGHRVNREDSLESIVHVLRAVSKGGKYFLD